MNKYQVNERFTSILILFSVYRLSFLSTIKSIFGFKLEFLIPIVVYFID